MSPPVEAMRLRGARHAAGLAPISTPLAASPPTPSTVMAPLPVISSELEISTPELPLSVELENSVRPSPRRLMTPPWAQLAASTPQVEMRLLRNSMPAPTPESPNSDA